MRSVRVTCGQWGSCVVSMGHVKSVSGQLGR